MYMYIYMYHTSFLEIFHIIIYFVHLHTCMLWKLKLIFAYCKKSNNKREKKPLMCANCAFIMLYCIKIDDEIKLKQTRN